MTSGEAWLKMRHSSIEELIEISQRLGYGIEEEEARSQLRLRLHNHIQAKKEQ